MRPRNKWVASLVCGATLLVVAACTRPVATVAGDPGSSGTSMPEPVAVRGKGVAEDPPRAEGSKSGGRKAEETPAGYEFPGDQGGSLMKRLLTPRDSFVSAQATTAPLRRKPLAQVEDPSPGLPVFAPSLPRVSLYGPATPVRPTFVIPENILGDAGLSLALPEVQTMPTGPLLKLPSVDVNKPTSLAPMAQPLSGREPNTDPTKAASTEAATRGAMPVRTRPVPFIAESVPDPFENEAAVRKLAPPPDETLPLGSSSQAPKK